MIPRYEKKEISEIWSQEYKFKTFFKIELTLLDILEKKGAVPNGTARKTENLILLDFKRIEELDTKLNNEVLAFCTSIIEKLPAEQARYFHFGITSSDILDTTLHLQVKKSLQLILPQLKETCILLYRLADKYKKTLTIGRTHGAYSEPMSFGQKWLNFYAELSRRLEELEDFLSNDLTLKLSGTVGNFAMISPEVEEELALLLQLKPEPVSSQILPRDRIAKLTSLTGRLATTLERIALEIRLLHRSEVNEVREGVGKTAMVQTLHRKTPLSSENITGIARVMRSHEQIALENCLLWHERDMSHSSAERLFIPDNLGLCFYALKRMNKTLGNLGVDPEQVELRTRENLTYLSTYFLHFLIEKTTLNRDILYEMTSQAGLCAQQQKSYQVFQDKLQESLQNKGVSLTLPTLNFDEIRSIYLKHIDIIFNRTLQVYPLPKA